MSPSGARQCPKCAGEVREGWRVCPACATPLPAGEDAETETMFAASSASSVEEGRFPAGTVLAGRYRVLGLIGHGGMGEVYRAYDLILNQAVALKFLGRANMDEAALARFRNEVRIARQVSHPNVCRAYDIGFIEGFHFLSMEYLDGEDLGFADPPHRTLAAR
jgi:Protein kinase domain